MKKIEAVQRFVEYSARRKKLVELVKEQHSGKTGLIMLAAGFEPSRTAFRQESSFYYYTGLEEPGCVLIIDQEGIERLYVPNCINERAKWTRSDVPMEQASAAMIGMHEIAPMGDPISGYQCSPLASVMSYRTIITLLQQLVQRNEFLFTIAPRENALMYIEQRIVLDKLQNQVSGLHAVTIDIASIIASMRRKKSTREIETLYKAIEITQLAHESAAQAIAVDITEAEVQAALEYIITGSQARIAFPSIVAAGKHSTVLHYTQNDAVLKAGDLVVVDIGAEKDYYCADLSRTYPVSGMFSKRQREIYELVLETQEYIAALARPGMWLNNKSKPEESLHHRAVAYLQDKGYDSYFVHGIGHYLGLDVHDVGDYTTPLQEGDVITIEPGIYIPSEQLGVRIEDNYWIVKDGCECLSEHLPKDADAIEQMVQGNFDESESESEEDMEAYDFDSPLDEIEH